MKNDPYGGKKTTPSEAVGRIKSGERVLIGSGAAEPQLLVGALAKRGAELADTEVVHILTLGAAPYAENRFTGGLRHNALFIGPNVRGAVSRGEADYTPCFLSEIPSLMRSGRLPIDVALIETTPPEDGVCSLGVSVDIMKAAVETARLVIAQVNPRMPWTEGDTFVKVDDIDAFVPGEQLILELERPKLTADSIWIGRYVAALVEDGATIQLGIGTVPNAIVSALENKKNLGVHSEMLSDGIIDLMEKGAVTGRRKTLHPGKVVASFCLGTRRLYDAVDRNPAFAFFPSDYVNSPLVIAQNERMVAINSALMVDLTGQVASDSIGSRLYSGVGGQVDFIRGAALARGGRSIIALPSTAKSGSVSRIVPALCEGTGVVTTRADVDFVVTEHGIASLKGKTLRERCVALIQIAHPDHRESLVAAAKAMGYLDAGHVIPRVAEPYHVELETRGTFGKWEVWFRPEKPSDEKRLKEFFYAQCPESTYSRYGIYLKRMSEPQFQELVAVDYKKSLAIAGFVRENGRERMIAEARYIVVPGTSFAEAAFTVHDEYQGAGIGTFLVNYLTWIAKERGLIGFQAEIAGFSPRMRRILEHSFRRVKERDLGPDGVMVTVLFSQWKGHGNPAQAMAAAPAL